MPVILCNCPPPVPSGTADGQVPVWDETTQSWIPGTAPAPDCCPPDGTTDGDTLVWDGSEWVAQQPSGGIDSGTSFPASPSAGDVFYRTDLREMAYYDGTRWVGNPFSLAMATYGSFAAGISETSYVYGAAVPDFPIYVETWDVARSIVSADASNYWTYYLYYYPTGYTNTNLVTQNVTAPTVGWAKTRHSIGAVVPSTSLIFLSFVTKTGSPGILGYMTTLIVRRIFT